MRMLRPLIAATALLAVSACARETSPVSALGDRSVVLRTDPPMTAQCRIDGKGGAWSTMATPERFDIGGRIGTFDVTCRTPSGWAGATTVTNPPYDSAIVVPMARIEAPMSEAIIRPAAPPPVVAAAPAPAVRAARPARPRVRAAVRRAAPKPVPTCNCAVGS